MAEAVGTGLTNAQAARRLFVSPYTVDYHLRQIFRPHRATHHVPITRHVTMPRTASFPSGHAASASAFATGVATAWPEAGLPLSAAATLVGYSGVQTGVHHPVDVIVGSLTGTTLVQLTAAALGRRRGRRASAF